MATFKVPTTAEFKAALKEIHITEKQRAMLPFHFNVHNRTATFHSFAKAVVALPFKTGL